LASLTIRITADTVAPTPASNLVFSEDGSYLTGVAELNTTIQVFDHKSSSGAFIETASLTFPAWSLTVTVNASPCKLLLPKKIVNGSYTSQQFSFLRRWFISYRRSRTEYYDSGF
jgi:hypothetical protein